VASAPKPCNGRTLSWTVGSLTCTAPAGATLHGGSTSLIASNGYSGTASFACNNGLWSVTGPTSCTAPPCSPSTLAWTSGGVGCDGPAVSVASGSSTWVSSTNGNSGSAQFACINGYWSAPSGGSCTAPPPATTSGSLQCPGVGGNITWNSGASTCSAFVPAAAVSPGTYSYSSDNGTPGSYQRRCNGNGTWSDLGGTCGSAPPAAVPCPGGTLPWTVGAASCQATIPVSSAGSYTFSSTNGNAGVFTAQCNNDGTWGELGRTCEPSACCHLHVPSLAVLSPAQRLHAPDAHTLPLDAQNNRVMKPRQEVFFVGRQQACSNEDAAKLSAADLRQGQFARVSFLRPQGCGRNGASFIVEKLDFDFHD